MEFVRWSGPGHLHQGDHEGMERNHHRRHAQEEDEPAVAGLGTGELEPGQRGQENDAAAVPRHVTTRVFRKRLGYRMRREGVDDSSPSVQPCGRATTFAVISAKVFSRVDGDEEQRIEVDQGETGPGGSRRERRPPRGRFMPDLPALERGELDDGDRQDEKEEHHGLGRCRSRSGFRRRRSCRCPGRCSRGGPGPPKVRLKMTSKVLSALERE